MFDREIKVLTFRLWWKSSVSALNSSSFCYVTFLVYISLQRRRRQGVRF